MLPSYATMARQGTHARTRRETEMPDFNGDGRFDGSDMEFLGGGSSGGGSYGDGCGCGGCLKACGYLLLGIVALCSTLYACTSIVQLVC